MIALDMEPVNISKIFPSELCGMDTVKLLTLAGMLTLTMMLLPWIHFTPWMNFSPMLLVEVTMDGTRARLEVADVILNMLTWTAPRECVLMVPMFLM
jgi:hypothetical protein